VFCARVAGVLIAGDSDSWGTNPPGSGSDFDGDQILDGFDNCPDDFNPSQEDSDLDEIGDICDPFPDDPDNDLAQALVDLAAAEAELVDTRELLDQCWAAAPDCTDGMDNDGDGFADYPDDPGCKNPGWATENPECSDGIDNADNDNPPLADWDGAGLGDPDPQCAAAWDNSESPSSGTVCGLGAELAPLLPSLMWLWRRRRTWKFSPQVI